MVRILVTGIGGQVTRALRERGGCKFEVFCVGRPHFDLFRLQTIWATVRDVQPHVIVSTAAYTAVDRAEDEPEMARAINAIGRPSVFAAAPQELGARLIHISTDYVYDERKNAPYVESDPTDPQSVYGDTKLASEMAVRDKCRANVILRTAWVYSPFGQNFVRNMLELAATRGRLAVVDDQHGNPTSAYDLADAILTIVGKWQSAPDIGLGEIYHCAGTGSSTWYELARYALGVSRELGGPFAEVTGIVTSEWPTEATRPATSRLNCDKLARDFGWRSP